MGVISSFGHLVMRPLDPTRRITLTYAPSTRIQLRSHNKIKTNVLNVIYYNGFVKPLFSTVSITPNFNISPKSYRTHALSYKNRGTVENVIIYELYGLTGKHFEERAK